MGFKIDKSQPPIGGASTGHLIQRLLFLESMGWTQACDAGITFVREELSMLWPLDALAKAEETPFGCGCIRWLARFMFKEQAIQGIHEAHAQMMRVPLGPTWEQDYRKTVTKPCVDLLRAWIVAEETAWEEDVTRRLAEL